MIWLLSVLLAIAVATAWRYRRQAKFWEDMSEQFRLLSRERIFARHRHD